jgi:hypothetical protein
MYIQVGGEHRFHRSKFARGPFRRFVDWCDWMLPEVCVVNYGCDTTPHEKLLDQFEPSMTV